MTRWKLVALCAALAPVASCVTRTHQENAALAMPWPKAPQPELLAYGWNNPDFPSVGGDILKGTSPADQAAARSAASRPPPTPRKP